MAFLLPKTVQDVQICDSEMRKKIENLSSKITEVPPEGGSLSDLLDFLADLLIRKWMEEQKEHEVGKNIVNK